MLRFLTLILVILASSQRCVLCQQPNFVVIFTDDQGYGDLSCFGSTQVKTPTIDRLATEGARLTSFYVAAPVCTPSRAALMTGCYPKRVSLATGSNFAVLLAGDPKGLHPNEITLAEVLKKKGYATAIFGKWHLGDQPQFLPTRQGFDEYFGFPYSHDIHPFHPAQKRFQFPPLPLLESEEVIETDPNANLITQRVTQHALDFIEAHQDKPFFLYVPHPMPHRPLHVSEDFKKQIPNAVWEKLSHENGGIDYPTRDQLFPAVISEIDWSVAKIVECLKKCHLEQNTLVLFTSDNGPAVGSAGPLRGRKGSTFEGGMREPTVAWWPDHIQPGQTIDEIVTSMDLLPTFAKLAGAEVPKDRVIDGLDISSVLLNGAKSPRDRFFYHRGNKLMAVRSGPWKYHWDLPRRGKSAPKTALYYLPTDMGEQHDVSAEHPEIVKRLQKYLEDFETELGAGNNLSKNCRPPGLAENPRPLSLRTSASQ